MLPAKLKTQNMTRRSVEFADQHPPPPPEKKKKKKKTPFIRTALRLVEKTEKILTVFFFLNIAKSGGRMGGQSEINITLYAVA